MLQERKFYLPKSTDPLEVTKRGLEILNDPRLNKGTAFTFEERKALGLSGLLPPFRANMEEQVQRIMENYRHHTNPLDKYIFLTAIADRNVTLFYRVLMDNLLEMTPIMYTPTVGHACQQFGHIYRKNRGMYLNLNQKGRIAQVLDNWPADEIDIIVISDGSRILGLGDLGANGMGIPIGKLVLYVAGAGLHPDRTLPILLDVGTDNDELLNDPLYLGITRRRIHGDEFYEIADEFVKAATARWPNVLIQWEDFTNDKAFPLLNRYRDDVLCFNDDIQGTGSVALAGLLAAMRMREEHLSDQRIVFCGAGSAAVGIADMICAGIADEHSMTVEEARKLVWMCDSKGLVTTTRKGKLDKHKIPYARDEKPAPELLDVVKRVKPTIIIGASGHPHTFTEEVVKQMHKHCKQPVIFALSNPTSKAECTAEEAYTWTGGNAIFASGSPFPAVRLEGRIFVPGQGNNMFIFPGVGLGAVVCGARKVTDEMFFTAAKTLAHMVTEEELEAGTIYPDLAKIRQISLAIAAAVARLAWEQGLAQYAEPKDIRQYVRDRMYHPDYRPYVAA
ncbi:MAG: NAD-dependent malic enzyme [Xanthomonadales bacterium]|nr:NAD-dependent malic enzyme [Gammaproteobacteria bacterium]MBT8053206.1 NAD-dependent malic enzyme [Gammaproteobacteria bacterium]NND57182.1 NAD-dependent malic enzyme [Xanthomonadales bacterium]NNK50246.1 NAD-dependent malic enzyme [Xanthomonadales bacterium]